MSKCIVYTMKSKKHKYLINDFENEVTVETMNNDLEKHKLDSKSIQTPIKALSTQPFKNHYIV